MNILLIVCDTTRADHLGCYGYFRNTSPNIDLLARDGITFKHFYTSGSPTGPSFTCLYTGLHTIKHKYYQFTRPDVLELDESILTLPEILRIMGYRTAAVDNLIDFPPHSKHWVRGYEFYMDPSPLQTYFFPPWLQAEEVNRELIPWIKEHSKEKFFLFAHYWDPHDFNQPQRFRKIFHHKKDDLSDLDIKRAPSGYDYVPGWGKIGEFPEGEIDFKGRKQEKLYFKVSIDLYDGAISYMDSQIGEVIRTLEDESILDDTLIIITGDHGEQLGQHYNPSDGYKLFWQHSSLYETIVHVPLLMRYPKSLPKGVKIEGFGQHVDLLPTILDLLETPHEVLNMDGKSLLPLLKGEVIRKELFMESPMMQRSIKTQDWKLTYDIKKNRVEIYNTEKDPMEIYNMVNIEKGKSKALKNELDKWVKSNLREGEKDPILNIPDSLGHMKNRERKSIILKALNKSVPYIM